MEHWEFQIVRGSATPFRQAVLKEGWVRDIYFYDEAGQPIRRLRNVAHETYDFEWAPKWPGDDAAVGVGSGPWCHGYAYP